MQPCMKHARDTSRAKGKSRRGIKKGQRRERVAARPPLVKGSRRQARALQRRIFLNLELQHASARVHRRCTSWKASDGGPVGVRHYLSGAIGYGMFWCALHICGVNSIARQMQQPRGGVRLCDGPSSSPAHTYTANDSRSPARSLSALLKKKGEWPISNIAS
jgi:hypothetical protein